MRKEAFESRAEIIEFSVFAAREPVFGTSSAAYGEPGAAFAHVREVGFHTAECQLPFRVEHVIKTSVHNIPEPRILIDEEVACEYVAVVLYYNITPALGAQRAFRGGETGITEEQRFKKTH